MKLTLNAAPVIFTAIHPDSGIEFTLQSLAPKKYDEIQGKSKNKNGTGNSILWAANAAEYCIVDWQRPDPEKPDDPGIDAECTKENKRAFGEKFAFDINPWIIDQCMALERSRADEVSAAKND